MSLKEGDIVTLSNGKKAVVRTGYRVNALGKGENYHYLEPLPDNAYPRYLYHKHK
ncbi:MAG: hypothetical protein J7K26_03555 [Candidatus Aenigmarchaeota archaeon]|nr:hypothetical protein [Candidatus Aenigmarchaeota archaeon]